MGAVYLEISCVLLRVLFDRLELSSRILFDSVHPDGFVAAYETYILHSVSFVFFLRDGQSARHGANSLDNVTCSGLTGSR